MAVLQEMFKLFHELNTPVVMGTCATFSATAPLARTKKGGARCGGACVKNNGAVAVVLIRAISAPFSNQI